MSHIWPCMASPDPPNSHSPDWTEWSQRLKAHDLSSILTCTDDTTTNVPLEAPCQVFACLSSGRSDSLSPCAHYGLTYVNSRLLSKKRQPDLPWCRSSYLLERHLAPGGRYHPRPLYDFASRVNTFSYRSIDCTCRPDAAWPASEVSCGLTPATMQDAPHPHTMMTSEEVDWLVYSYLQESGKPCESSLRVMRTQTALFWKGGGSSKLVQSSTRCSAAVLCSAYLYILPQDHQSDLPKAFVERS